MKTCANGIVYLFLYFVFYIFNHGTIKIWILMGNMVLVNFL